MVGVVAGVPLGVELALLAPTRVFLVDERGVTFVVMKGFTGVTSSCAGGCDRGVLPGVVRRVRAAVVVEAVVEATEGASRGARLVFAVRAVARVGFNGREVLLFWRSMGMVLCSGGRSEGNSAGSRGGHGQRRRQWAVAGAVGGVLTDDGQLGGLQNKSDLGRGFRVWERLPLQQRLGPVEEGCSAHGEAVTKGAGEGFSTKRPGTCCCGRERSMPAVRPHRGSSQACSSPNRPSRHDNRVSPRPFISRLHYRYEGVRRRCTQHRGTQHRGTRCWQPP